MRAGDVIGDCVAHVGTSYRHTFEPATGVGGLTFMVKAFPSHVTGLGKPIVLTLTAAGLPVAVGVILSGLTLTAAATLVIRPGAIGRLVGRPFALGLYLRGRVGTERAESVWLHIQKLSELIRPGSVRECGHNTQGHYAVVINRGEASTDAIGHQLVWVKHQGAHELLNEVVPLLCGDLEHLARLHEVSRRAGTLQVRTDCGVKHYRSDEVAPHPPVGDREVTPGGAVHLNAVQERGLNIDHVPDLAGCEAVGIAVVGRYPVHVGRGTIGVDGGSDLEGNLFRGHGTRLHFVDAAVQALFSPHRPAGARGTGLVDHVLEIITCIADVVHRYLHVIRHCQRPGVVKAVDADEHVRVTVSILVELNSRPLTALDCRGVLKHACQSIPGEVFTDTRGPRGIRVSTGDTRCCEQRMYRDPPVTRADIIVDVPEGLHQKLSERFKKVILEVTICGTIPLGRPRWHAVHFVTHECLDDLGSHGGRVGERLRRGLRHLRYLAPQGDRLRLKKFEVGLGLLLTIVIEDVAVHKLTNVLGDVPEGVVQVLCRTVWLCRTLACEPGRQYQNHVLVEAQLGVPD
eukprot:16452347-Heterocapsa_arctica.AAC.2